MIAQKWQLDRGGGSVGHGGGNGGQPRVVEDTVVVAMEAMVAGIVMFDVLEVEAVWLLV